MYLWIASLFAPTVFTYVSTVGFNEGTVKKYIQEQEKHDIMMDKITAKELDNPFKGSVNALWPERSEGQRLLGAGPAPSLIGFVQTTPRRGDL